MSESGSVEAKEPVTYQAITSAEELLALDAAGLFDEAPQNRWATSFFENRGNRLIMAFQGKRPVGFASATEISHPDKPVELYLNELGVDEVHQGRGIGRSLVQAVLRHARSRGIMTVWTLTEPENAAARRTYESAGGRAPAHAVLYEWLVDDAH